MFVDLFADPNLSDVMGWLKDFPCSRWYELGIVLMVPHTKLDEIRANHPNDVSRCLTEVIKYWLRNSKVSWEVLWKALCKHSVAEVNLGIEIQDWYMKKIWNDPRQVSCFSVASFAVL